jgi:hypothetical protein
LFRADLTALIRALGTGQRWHPLVRNWLNAHRRMFEFCGGVPK